MRMLLVFALFALAGCGSPRETPAGGVTRAEADALNDAAVMLDNNAVAPVAASNRSRRANR